MGFNVYMCGVGGQGIGMLSEVLLRAADHAGFRTKAVDTHGLAQRGGIVISHLRIGEDVFSPLIAEGRADLVIGLEMHEAYRALERMSKPGSTLVYYQVCWQPLPVRLGADRSLTDEDIHRSAQAKHVRVLGVQQPDLADRRMQNMVVLGRIDHYGLIPGVSKAHYLAAMEDLMTEGMLAENRAVFERNSAA
ncbi:MAG: 2-oxoacid:acceptor oxidoreductase family protein [Thermodesulfobacteriota bacterium]